MMLKSIKSISQAIKTIFFLIMTFFIVLYLIIGSFSSTSNNEENSSDSESPVVEISKEEFISKMTPYAQDVSASHGVWPSLLIAQAAIESNWGNSGLAQESNNYFGVKNPKGKEYVTEEFKQDEWIEIKATFKNYESVYDSILDYADLLKNGTSWNSDLYEDVIKAATYKEAAYELEKAGYATDPNYAEKVIEIIEQYKLYELDSEE